jgi:cysteinyl-tRNA synthetase
LISLGREFLGTALDERNTEPVSDLAIYRAHAARFEAEFFEDMESLGIRPPDVVTRVSEYIPEIVEYIEQIIANGMAYEVKGSVYFDTAAFR